MSNSRPNTQSEVKDDVNIWLEAVRNLYRKTGRQKEFTEEEPFIKLYFEKLIAVINQQPSCMYKIVKPWNMGGTGIILEAAHKNLPNRKLVLKLNRPLPLEKLPVIDNKPRSMVENERQVLTVLDHMNIISVLDTGHYEIKIGSDSRKLSFIVEPLIPNAKTLRQYVDSLALKDKDMVTVAMLDNSLLQLAKLLIHWVQALVYVHEKNFAYLDLKPDNALVDRDGHLVAIDFGSAQEFGEDNTPVYIFVTKYYAHKKLIDSMLKQTSENRVKCSIMRKEITPSLDFYALGKSILELLSIFLQEESHPHDFPQRPLFRAIHFLATRLLDGQNKKKPKEEILTEFFGGLDEEDYKSIKYIDLKDVLVDLQKETGVWDPEHIIPELSTFSKTSLRVVINTNTVLSPRLRELIEHPLIARLKFVSQLGLISLVYPTAIHSRYEHVLGTLTYTASYIKALFHDSQNPVFRNIVTEEYINGALLAALFHDLGQYPLAHDLEEVCPKIFSHKNLSLALLNNETKNQNGKTVADLIQDKGRWGVDMKCLERILGTHSMLVSGQTKVEDYQVDFKAEMLSALIDGPIDADKADYLLRDSTECRLPYGNQLDIERLLRVLTTVRIRPQNGSKNRATVCVYEKGRASTDSFGLARYLLFSSVYWHHTSRIIKTMLQYATADLLPKEAFQPGSNSVIVSIREKLTDFVLNLVPPFDIAKETLKENAEKKRAQKLKPKQISEDVITQITEDTDELEKQQLSIWYPGICSTDWLMLEWLKSLSKSKRANTLIDRLQCRRFYKRCFTFQREKDVNGDLVSGLSSSNWPEKIKICELVQKHIEEIIDQKRKDEISMRTRSLADPTEIEKIFRKNLAILIDAPDPKILTDPKGRPLLYLPELERKTYYHESLSPVKANYLTNALESLMGSISPVRVLCHPSLRQIIQLYITRDEARTIIENAIHEVKG